MVSSLVASKYTTGFLLTYLDISDDISDDI